MGSIVVGIAKNKNPQPSNTNIPQSYQSYFFESDSVGKTYSAKIPSKYSFSILDQQGNTLKDFAITHTKQMHLIVVRKDF